MAVTCAADTRVGAYEQRVVVSLRVQGELFVLGMFEPTVIAAKVNPQDVLFRPCHAVDILVAQPELCVNVAEAALVLFPRAVEVDGTVLATLEYLQSVLI